MDCARNKTKQKFLWNRKGKLNQAGYLGMTDLVVTSARRRREAYSLLVESNFFYVVTLSLGRKEKEGKEGGELVASGRTGFMA